jgi:hypothetical protein
LLVDTVTQSIDFSAGNMFDFSYTTDSDVYITTTNASAGKNAIVRMYVTGSATSSLTLPNEWIYIGEGKPTQINANTYYVLSLTSFGNNDANIVCNYSSTK